MWATFGPFWAILSHILAALVHFGSFLAILGHFVAFLDKFAEKSIFLRDCLGQYPRFKNVCGVPIPCSVHFILITTTHIWGEKVFLFVEYLGFGNGPLHASIPPLHLPACFRFQIQFSLLLCPWFCATKNKKNWERLERKNTFSWVFEKIAGPLHASIPPPAAEMPQWSPWHGSCYRCNTSGCFNISSTMN